MDIETEAKLEIRRVTYKGREFSVREDGECWYCAWTIPIGRKRKAKRVSFNPVTGYPRCSFMLNYKQLFAWQHVLVALAFHGECPVGLQVDHINGDKFDNSAKNLRYKTSSSNQRGYSKPHDGVSSKYRGVCRNKKNGKWRAAVRNMDSRIVSAGSFADEQDAARAFDEFAEKNGYDEQALNRTHHPELSDH